MNWRRPLIVLLCGMAALCYADDEREERRNLRERRERVRIAIKRVEKCFQTGDILPCLGNDDRETREAVFRYYLKHTKADGNSLLKVH